MKGYRTLVLNGAMVAAAALAQWAVNIDWTLYLSPNLAIFIAGLVNIGLRLITNTPVGIGRPT